MVSAKPHKWRVLQLIEDLAFFDIHNGSKLHNPSDWEFDNNTEEFKANLEKFKGLQMKLRKILITDIEDLYLTSGGRIVLDHGYGEYFNSSDSILFTKEELRCGIKPERFIEKINKILEERKKMSIEIKIIPDGRKKTMKVCDICRNSGQLFKFTTKFLQEKDNWSSTDGPLYDTLEIDAELCKEHADEFRNKITKLYEEVQPNEIDENPRGQDNTVNQERNELPKDN